MNLQFEYNVQDLPHLIIIESSQNEDSLEEYPIHTYQGKEYKYKELYNFMQKFAGSGKKESEQYRNKKEDEKLKQEIYNQPKFIYTEIDKSNFTREVLDTSDACLVYFTTLEQDDDIVFREFKHFNKLLKRLEGIVKVFVFRIYDQSQDYMQII